MFNTGFLNSEDDADNQDKGRRVLRLEKRSKIKPFIEKINSNLSIWKRSLKSIEKNCGCGVVSYFRFISWLLKLNIILLLVLFSILITPYLLIKPYHFEQYSEVLQEGNISNRFTKALYCTNNFVMENETNYLNLFLNILQGKGPLEHSPMFMGYYFNKTYFNISSNTFSRTLFNTPVAYGSAFGLCIFLSLIATLYSSGQNYKNYMVDETEFNKSFGLSVFAGYDYGITKEKRIIYSRNILSKKLKIEFKQKKENIQRALMTTNKLILLYVIRIIINVLFVGFLLLVYVAIAYAQNAPLKARNYKIVRENQVISLLVDYIPAVVISGINVIFPIINNKMVTFEKYRSTYAMGVCLKRIILVQATSLLVFMITLLDQVKESNGFDEICQQTTKIKCWETFIGQQFYRLSFLGFVTSIIVGPFFQFIRAQLYIRKMFGKFLGPLVFDLSTEGVLLISSQTQCWMGLWFCPFLPIFMIVKLVLLFYIRKLMFMRNYFVPNMETLSVAGGQRFFQDMLSYSLAFVMLPVGYLLSKKIPSRGCSPFRIYQGQSATFASSLKDYVTSLSGILETFYNVLESKYTSMVILSLLVIIIYVKYAESKTQMKYLSILRKQIIIIQKDKNFYNEMAMKINSVLIKREALLNKEIN